MYLAGKYNYVTSFGIIKLEEVDIILIENFQCKDKNELHARERYWIEQNMAIVVNKCIPTRTGKEYQKDNKEKLLKYRIDHKESKQKNTCTCGGKYTYANKLIHLRTTKHKQ